MQRIRCLSHLQEQGRYMAHKNRNARINGVLGKAASGPYSSIRSNPTPENGTTMRWMEKFVGPIPTISCAISHRAVISWHWSWS